MGSSTLFYCLALSMVAVAAVSSTAAAEQVGPNEGSHLSAPAMKSSTFAAEVHEASSPARKLVDTPGSKCPVKFEKKTGYVELGKKCQKPPYKECCELFKKFACPYSKLINKIENGCVDDMFYFMRIKGNMDTSVFFYNCMDDPNGLKC
uniref:GPI-anchored protein LLG1-like domain-containing protein n=1 Tax=Oryza punctata TaxID=4537 RepID=A0A0E0JIC4_ORYPU